MEQLQIRNIVPYSHKVDVWAAGVLAYELVTGRPPFEVDNESETVKLILTSDDIHMPSCFSTEWSQFVRCVSSVSAVGYVKSPKLETWSLMRQNVNLLGLHFKSVWPSFSAS
jgi:serine/threonine protein kinase